MAALRLLALSTSFPLRPESCAGVFVRHLYRNLPTRWQVSVVCPDDAVGANRNVVRAWEGSLAVFPVRYAPRPWRVLAQRSGGVVSSLRKAPWQAALVPMMLVGLAWRCVRMARGADIIHANWAICGLVAGLVGKWIRLPVVTTLRGDDVARANQSRLEGWILDAAVKYSAAVACVSEAMVAQLKRRYPERAQDIHACLNGVDDAFLSIPMPQERRSGALRIVSIGSLIRRKGYDLLIDAVARMRHTGSLTVRIAGEGPERLRLLQQAQERGVADRFEFIGEIVPEQIPSFLQQADLFVLSSRSEGRPNVVIEALAAGLPVVCTALPGIEGLVESGSNGWVVGVGDAEAIAQALDHAVTDPDELRRRALAAHEHLRRHPCGWRETGARYDALFEDVLSRRKRSS